MRIAVFGADGIGGYHGGRLAQSGEEVAVVARGDHLEAIRSTACRSIALMVTSYFIQVLRPMDLRRLDPWTWLFSA